MSKWLHEAYHVIRFARSLWAQRYGLYIQYLYLLLLLGAVINFASMACPSDNHGPNSHEMAPSDTVGDLEVLLKQVLLDVHEVCNDLNFEAAEEDGQSAQSTTTLHLAGRMLMELPSAVGRITTLQSLNLSYNNLSSFPDSVRCLFDILLTRNVCFFCHVQRILRNRKSSSVILVEDIP